MRCRYLLLFIAVLSRTVDTNPLPQNLEDSRISLSGYQAAGLDGSENFGAQEDADSDSPVDPTLNYQNPSQIIDPDRTSNSDYQVNPNTNSQDLSTTDSKLSFVSDDVDINSCTIHPQNSRTLKRADINFCDANPVPITGTQKNSVSEPDNGRQHKDHQNEKEAPRNRNEPETPPDLSRTRGCGQNPQKNPDGEMDKHLCCTGEFGSIRHFSRFGNVYVVVMDCIEGTFPI